MSERKHFLDLTRCHFQRTLGDIQLYGTWVPRGDDDDHTEPALVLMSRRFGGRPCCVALSSAYLYNDPRYCARAAHEFAQGMGFEPGLALTHRIANIIHDHLQDLIEMPPEPTQAVVVADATVDIDGRKRSVEIISHEQAPI